MCGVKVILAWRKNSVGVVSRPGIQTKLADSAVFNEAVRSAVSGESKA